MSEETLDYQWFYCPECNEEYMFYEDDETCHICNCQLESL